MLERLRGIMIEEPRNFHNPMYEYRKTDLYDVYKEGWWITEIFGSKAVLVRLSQCTAKRLKKPHFISVQSRIDISQITPEAQIVIEAVKKQKWKRYKRYLLENKNERKK